MRKYPHINQPVFPGNVKQMHLRAISAASSFVYIIMLLRKDLHTYLAW